MLSVFLVLFLVSLLLVFLLGSFLFLHAQMDGDKWRVIDPPELIIVDFWSCEEPDEFHPVVD